MRVQWCVGVLLVLVAWASVAFGQITRSALPADMLGIPTTSSGVIYPITARTGAGSTCTAATLNAALSAMGATRATLLLSPHNGEMALCTWTLEANVTIPETVHLVVAAPVVVNAGSTLALYGPHETLIGPNWYSGAGTVTFADNIPLGSAESYASRSANFVVAGGVHGTSGSTTTPAFSTRAWIEGRDVFQAAQAVTFPSGDGAYWVGLRHDLTVTPAGWTCVASTHYCWMQSAVRPPAAGEIVLLSRSIVESGAVTEVRALFATNSHNPGRIYGHDPYIGMQCDGVTDDSAALQRAIDLATQRGGATVELPAGQCVVGNVTITHLPTNTVIGDGGGVDANALGRGCPSLVGQGIGVTVLTAPATLTAEQAILTSACFAFGSGQVQIPANYNQRDNPGAVEIAHLSFQGKATREQEYHGLVMEGTYARVHHVQFHYINGHALWVGRNTKCESCAFDALHVRASGRYVTDCGCSTGTASRNAAAVYIGKPADAHNNNNLHFSNMDVGFAWYAGIHVDCSVGFTSQAWFVSMMLHNHENPTATNQGRLNQNAGLVYIDGTCSNINFIGGMIISPGADSDDTNNTAGPPVAGFHLNDTTGVGRPDSIFISNYFMSNSCCGQAIRITKASTVFLDNIRVRSGDFLDGQLVVVDDAITTGLLSLCNTIFPNNSAVLIDETDTGMIRDCLREIFTVRIPGDAELSRVSNGGTWSIAAGGTNQVRAHGLGTVNWPCTPQARDIHVVHTDEPDSCTETFLTAIDSTNFTINCNAAPGSDGAAGEWRVDVRGGCNPAQFRITEPDILVLFTAKRSYFIHEAWLMTADPGIPVHATNYVRAILVKRKILSTTDVAEISTQSKALIAWTPILMTTLSAAERTWASGDSLAFRTIKEGAGAVLPQMTLTVIVSTLPADQ